METENQNPNHKITNLEISSEMKEAYLQYSMSVIVGRALPDVRDGLKPVHRRVLFAMNELSNYHNKPYKKSARVVGDVIGKYHPHGDSAVYDAIVRLAQDFSMRYPLVDGQGNFGSIDGDSAAAMRYTEVRMTRLAEELIDEIDKETVSFSPNYDDSLMIPTVLPAKYPNLMVNGSTGIAVGMAANIPPHNLNEIIDGTFKIIENPEVTVDELMEIIPGPDFPTSGIIAGRKGIHQAYKKGRGIIYLKSVAEIIEGKNDKQSIIVTEIPYAVNKAKLIESIAGLVRDKKVEGISDIRDESSREGIRIVIELKRNENANVVLNRLFKYTQLQVSYSIIMLALDKNGRPRTFNLKEMLSAFLEHRRDVVTKRCIFELKKAEARAHILEGLKMALDQIDAIVALIRASKEPAIAKAGLIEKFSFSEIQAQAILDMRLQRLTGLEREKIIAELAELMKKIEWLRMVLGDIKEIDKLIVAELEDIKKRYGNERRTSIQGSDEEMDDEDLITKEDVVVTLTQTGYIKRIPVDKYKVQKRGGKGLSGMQTREEDVISNIFVANTHTTLLVFTDRGKVLWVKVHRLPLGTRTSKGKSINNVVQLEGKEKVMAILPIESFETEENVVFVTKAGIIKKTSIKEFSRPRANGIIALKTDLEDSLMDVRLSSGAGDIFLSTKSGMSIRFSETNVRAMGRTARGVKGITLAKDDEVVGLAVFEKDSNGNVLIVTEKGYGKRTELSEYRTQSRGGVGIIAQKTSDKTGPVIGTRYVNDDNDLIIISDKGMVIRMACNEVSIIGRNTQGVRLFNVKDGECVSDIAVTDSQKADEAAGVEADEANEDTKH
ncbi:MAG: DNA gyrase subunit A [Bdellovibrionota bacterium]|nr:DNA gyrase subunit A [Bdellovibrionota bacterium]